jgi:hypothetical protein
MEATVNSTPRNRLKQVRRAVAGENDPPHGFWLEVELENVADYLLEHRGLEDVPVNTIEQKKSSILGYCYSLWDFVVALLEGKKVYQYIVASSPKWVKARQKSQSIKDRPKNVLEISEVAAIKSVAQKTITDKLASGDLNGGQYSGVYYVVHDDKFETWLTSLKDPTVLHGRLIHLQDALDLYTGDDINELYQMAEEIEKRDRPIRGKYSKKSIRDHFEYYFSSKVPKTVAGLRTSLWMYIDQVQAAKYKLYGK